MRTPYHLLTGLAYIQTQGLSKDTAFANVATAATDATPIQCNLQPMRSDESLQFARETGQTFWKVFLAPVNTSGAAYTLTHDMKLVIGNVTYTCIGDLIDEAGLGVLYRMDLMRYT